MKDKIGNIIKVVIINYGILITVLVTLELTGQIGYKLYTGKFLYEVSAHRDVKIFKGHPYLSVVAKGNSSQGKGSKAVTINNEGWRITSINSPDNSPNKTNVLCLGGSTTFGVGVGDEDSWPYMLQEQLGPDYQVYNLGIPGYSTMEALIQLTSIAAELQPDIIIVYQGWNDIRNYHSPHKTADYSWNGSMQKVYLQVKKDKNPLDNFAITYITNRLNERVNDLITARTTDNEQEHTIAPSVRESSDTDSLFSVCDPYIDSIYVRNLKMIKAICAQLNAQSIFIPQALNLPLYENPENRIQLRTPYQSWTPYIESTAMPILIKDFNALMYNNIITDSSTHVVDSILYKYSWLPDHFVDEGHFSREGGELFTQIILEKIRSFSTR